MLKKASIIVAMSLFTFTAQAIDVPISGTVQSRCVITTDTPGTYGNPNAYNHHFCICHRNIRYYWMIVSFVNI